MKSLTVLVMCSLCCVNAYRIFPLPGQNVESNPKFGSLGQFMYRSIDQTTKSPEVNSRLASFTQRPSLSVQPGTQSHASTLQEKTSFGIARPVSTAQSSLPSTTQTIKAVTSIVTTQELRSEGSNRKLEMTIPAVKNTFGNVARSLSTAQPVSSTSHSLTAIKILNRPSSNNQATSFIYQKPQNIAVEPPANDLVPPKEDSKPGLPTKVITNIVPPRPTVAAPFNDLLPPKTS